MRQQLIQRWIKAIVLFMLLICSDQMSGQTIGLQVEPDHNVLFGDSIGGAGPRLMWLPGRIAFRAGDVNGTQWDTDSIGVGSFAFGGHNIGRGDNSATWGLNNATLGQSSTTWGQGNVSISTSSGTWGVDNATLGQSSTTWGQDNVTTGALSGTWGLNNATAGRSSTTWGQFNVTTGRNAGTWGEGNKNQSYSETVIGVYADTVAGADPTGWQAEDQLFVVGNGASDTVRNNAFTLLKNGNVGINSSTPEALLHIESDQSTGRAINLALVAGQSDRPSIQFSELVGDGSSTSGMSIEYNGTGAGAENEIRILNNADTELFSVHHDGDVDMTGFVKLGDSAPAVKYKTISVNAPSSGFFSSAIHGLTQSKIIGMQASLVDGINTIFPNDKDTSKSYNVRVVDTQVRITVEAGSAITGMPVMVTLTYIE